MHKYGIQIKAYVYLCVYVYISYTTYYTNLIYKYINIDCVSVFITDF